MRNVGHADLAIRLFVGLFLLAVGIAPLVGSSRLSELAPIWHWLALAIGAVLTVTAILRFCPAYTLFGWNTRRRD